MDALRTFRGVRIIKFRNADDLNRPFTMATGPTSMLDPVSAPIILNQASLHRNNVDPSVGHDTGDGDPAHAIEESAEPHEEADDSTNIEPIGANFANISEEALAEQNSAAKILQFCYRRLLTKRANRTSNLGPGLIQTRKDRFEEFTRAAGCIEWPQRSLYRPIFLGALPHLLTCLDHTRTIVVEEKTKVKRQRDQNMSHKSIEKLMDRQTPLTYVNKRLNRLFQLTNTGHDVEKLASGSESSKPASKLRRTSTSPEISNSWKSMQNRLLTSLARYPGQKKSWLLTCQWHALGGDM